MNRFDDGADHHSLSHCLFVDVDCSRSVPVVPEKANILMFHVFIYFTPIFSSIMLKTSIVLFTHICPPTHLGVVAGVSPVTKTRREGGVWAHALRLGLGLLS